MWPPHVRRWVTLRAIETRGEAFHVDGGLHIQKI